MHHYKISLLYVTVKCSDRKSMPALKCSLVVCAWFW